MRIAMNDRIHQPYRASSCPLLPPLLPLAGSHGILGVALSGAGPAVLVVVEGDATVTSASAAICGAVVGVGEPELQVCGFEYKGASEPIA